MRGLRGERGNVAIVVALMATGLLGVGALVVDYGAALVRSSRLQGGVDAAALAIAQRCADVVVDGQPALCNSTLATTVAGRYLDANLPDGVELAGTPELRTFNAGANQAVAGVVTITATSEQDAAFAWALGSGDLPVSTSATARWGPLAAAETFPLAACKGALPEPGQEVTLWSSPSGGELLGECEGAPDALPFGWLTPTDTEGCTTQVTVLPSTYLEVAPSDTPPSAGRCGQAITELLDFLQPREWCHWSWWFQEHCHEYNSQPQYRTRTLAVYDAAQSSGGRHPSFSLIAFEFTGARLGDREEHMRDEWDGVCDPDDGPYPEMEDVQCIRGRVTEFVTPDDGPLAELRDLTAAEIQDTTVLDVELVD